MPTPPVTPALPRPARLLLLLVSTLAASACSGAGDAPADDAAATTAETSTAAAQPFVDGPDLWLAALDDVGTGPEGGPPRLGEGRNVTRRAGYDNQPRFLPDGTILYTRGVADRTDIWRYDPAADAHAAVTETPDRSEYSPTPTPDGGFSAIVVEPDSLQRLWRFDLDGSGGATLFPDIAPVGYHAWVDDTRIGMFVLGDPPTLRSGRAGAAGPGTLHDEGIGRSLNRVPGVAAISYPVADGAEFEVRALVEGGAGPETVPLARIPAQDHAWTPRGYLLFGDGHRLMALGPVALPAEAPGSDGARIEPPRVVGALPDSTLVISRLAVSDDGASIVLVVDRPAN